MPRFFIKIFLGFCLIFVLSNASLFAQHPAWRNYTSTDGLPSNEVYGMMEDRRGFLWFATDQGLCRFNGYEFSRPVDTSTHASGSAFKIMEDAQGQIWFSRMDATLWLINKDTVRPWQFNNVPKEYLGKFRVFNGFILEKDGTVWLSLARLGILVVRPDGTHEILPGSDQYGVIFGELNGKLIYGETESTIKDVAEWKFIRRTQLSSNIFRWQHNKIVQLGRFPLKYEKTGGPPTRVFQLRNKDIILNLNRTFYLLRDNKLIWHGQKEVQVEQILEENDGSILLASIGGQNPGLLQFKSLDDFRNNKFKNLLPGHLVTSVLRSREGGWWATTRDAGVYYCKNATLDIFDQSTALPAADVLCLTSDNRTTVFAGLRPLAICAIRRTDGYVEHVPSPPGSIVTELSTLRFDTLTGRLWCSPDVCFLEHNHWSMAHYFDPSDHTNKYIYAKKLKTDTSGKYWWANFPWGFYKVDRKTGTSQRFILGVNSYQRIFSVTPCVNGDIWVTTINGPRLWHEAQYEQPSFNHPALRFLAHDAEILPGGGLVILLHGGGLLIRDKNGQCTNLTTQDGLTSNVFSSLRITPESRIYACSNTGLNILHRKQDGKWGIETVTTKHGLPSNQVNDVAFLGNETWVATNKGLARFREFPQPFPMPVPLLEKFEVNNRDTVFASNLQLPYNQNNIAIQFFALHFRSEGDIPYRYRLLPTDTVFKYTHNRTANFSLLPPGRFTFDVQAQNEDGQWSPSAQWPFEIRPPWWATWWFRVLLITILGSGVYFFVQFRLRIVRQEADLRAQVRDFETAALRAQMNPHFIFNCLQAIQSFIVRNDRDEAVKYLARFAKLVRLALHGSVDGRHSLTEEMSMLENYLYLEQLRFGDKFNFHIHAASGLDPEEITLPPLLVQPFVENALLHGLEGKENGGYVEVFFRKKGDRLEVSVTDNGKGFSHEENIASKTTLTHKSVGMMLTQKRLDLLERKGKSSEERLVRETIRDENGTVTGARVRIWIPLINS
jgi:ligand-binding sensor domain-containing protein/anti-sigma regulatory factor (Ser/Thr protein kinase)